MKTRSFILIAAASASAHASFLGDLATNAKRVGSSPYATGGDIILCLDSSANEYAHVFTNTAPKTYGSFTSATFTPAQAMTTRILLIGGGGGGGGANNTNPGGGGGGGFVETNNVQLSASAYTVKIASGGKIESGSMRAARGNKLVADGGTLKVNSDMFLAYVSGQTAGKIIVGADLSRVEVPGQFTAANAPAAIEFRIPRDGYSSVPVYGNNSQAFAASGNTITLGASKTLSEIRRNSKNIEMRLVYWQKGITYANVRFGETVTSAGMFFFKDASGTVYVRDGNGNVVKESDGTPCSAVLTEIWYRHKSSGGTALVIR